jgi:hypothetical protein
MSVRRTMNIKAAKIFVLAAVFLSFHFCAQEEASTDNFLALEKISEIGISEGDENYIFGSINDVEVDKWGNIYVLDQKMSRVTKFDEDGKFIHKFGKKGQGPGEFEFPEAMALNSERLIYVLSSERVIEFDENGRFIHQFPINFYGIDIAIDAEGNLILIGPSEDEIFHVYDKKGNHLYSFGEGFEIPEEFSKYKGSRLFKLPIRLWAIEDEIYILNPYRYEIHIYRDAIFIKKLSKDTPDYLRPEIKEAVPGGFAGYVSDNLIHKRGKRLFVFFNGRTSNWLDIYHDEQFVKSIKVEGSLKAIDGEGKFYFAEGEYYLRLVLYTLAKEN